MIRMILVLLSWTATAQAADISTTKETDNVFKFENVTISCERKLAINALDQGAREALAINKRLTADLRPKIGGYILSPNANKDNSKLKLFVDKSKQDIAVTFTTFLYTTHRSGGGIPMDLVVVTVQASNNCSVIEKIEHK